MPTCIYLNTRNTPPTCNAGACQSVAECSAKEIIYKEKGTGHDVTKVRYTTNKSKEN